MLAAASDAQASQGALRFFGTGTGQQDRVRIAIDDDAPGADASAPCDVGAGSFTLEFWLRGQLADNGSADGGGDAQTLDLAWIEGNVVLDRDIYGGSARDFGVSVAGGFVRFGLGSGDDAGSSEVTIEGDVNVLDGAWHHVACVRDAAAGRIALYVDGRLDFQSASGLNTADLSYPDDGAPGQATPWGPYLVLGAEKHDAGPAYSSFYGFLDELRLWDVARTQAAILADLERVVAPDAAGLVASYRFEEGAGTAILDASAAGSPAGLLIADLPGNGERVSQAQNPENVAPVTNGPLAAGYVRELVAGGLDEPVALESLPDGRLLVGERGGVVRVVAADGTLLPTPLLSLPTDVTWGERGLLGLAAAPDFAANGHLYAHYTTLEPRNRVARFTLFGNTASLASEVVVWENQVLAANWHHGGGLVFGPEGKLFIPTGDQGSGANAPNLGVEHGKLLRVNPDGSVPADNPFVATPGAQPTVFARGFRNPFRASYDAVTGALFVGDVGGNTSTSFEEVNRIVAGASYGWPAQEGASCVGGGCAQYTFPVHAWRQDDPRYYTTEIQASITLGPVYRGTVFPPAHRGSLFFADYANRWIRRLVLDDAGDVLGEAPFVDAPLAGTVVALEAAPDGALYTLSIGIPWSGATEEGSLWRIRYLGTGNAPPVAEAGASPRQGLAPLAVTFSSAGTSDPDGGPLALAYAWDFGDGAGSTQADPAHVYLATGEYTATLRVSDGGEEVEAPPLVIQVGNPPVATIGAPPAGTTYRAGDVIAYAGSASDVEDGALPAAALTWRVVLVHAGHSHPFLGPITGTSAGSFAVPTSGHDPADTHYELVLEARDSDGLGASVVHALQPIASALTFTSQPPGVPFFLDGQARTTPLAYASLVGFEHELAALPAFEVGGVRYVFGRWSLGRSPALDFRAPEGGRTIQLLCTSASETLVTTTVAAADRNADWYTPVGQAFGNLYDANALCAGRDAVGVYQMGLEFALAVPRDAVITSAELEFVPTADQSGTPVITLRAYDVADAPPFVAGSPTALTSHALLTSASLAWTAPPFTPGVPIRSPDLAALVQEVVARPDWVAGNHLGIVLDGAHWDVDNWRCVGNFASGSPPVLLVTHAQPVKIRPETAQPTVR